VPADDLTTLLRLLEQVATALKPAGLGGERVIFGQACPVTEKQFAELVARLLASKI
jgi:hypothetical protein